MKTHLLCLTILAAGLVCARAEVAAAQKRLEATVGDVIAMAERAKSASQLSAEVSPVLEKNLSFETMTRRAVGPGWKTFDPAQKAEATRLFTALIINSYCEKYTLGERAKVSYKPAAEPAPGKVEIPTTLFYKGSNYEVLYRMEQTDGWKITDILVEGVSLVANYRAQFDAHFKRGGAAAVLAALRESTGKLQ